MEHHPVFSRFPRPRGEAPDGFRIDFLGVYTRLAFEERMPYASTLAAEPPDPTRLPAFDEEYFEWIDVLEAVLEASGSFTMVELGAGYGRWLVRAVAALRSVNPLPFRLIAVEPEPTHFAWLQEHLRANGIDPEDHVLIQAAMTDHGRRVPFHVGNAAGWYGQALADGATAEADRRSRGRLRRFLPSRWRQAELAPEQTGVMRVPSVTLQKILRGLERVDLIDLDVQGAEADVLTQAIDQLDRKVRRVHVGTHSQAIEERLRRLFPAHGWENRNDYPCLKSSLTPYGEIAFNDGVQTWINPRLKQGAAPPPD